MFKNSCRETRLIQLYRVPKKELPRMARLEILGSAGIKKIKIMLSRALESHVSRDLTLR